MSTGIGKHKFNKDQDGRPRGWYLAICPYCGCNECDADHVDVEVGYVQCGPYNCPECGASEVSYLDKRELTMSEELTGWYRPFSPPSEHANTCCGQLVDHKTAKELYNNGLLDQKPEL